jgi:phage terminase large subunit-like protein
MAENYAPADYAKKWEDIRAASSLLEGPSIADRLAMVEREHPGFVEEILAKLGPEHTTMIAYDVDFWARPKQLPPPGEWMVHLHLQGRAGGKTFKGARWVWKRVEAGAHEIVFVGPSEDDIKEFMVGGRSRPIDGFRGSGFLDVLPPWVTFEYLEDDCQIKLPQFNATIHLHSAHVPGYRGPGPDTVWGDEFAFWRYPEKLLSNLRLACRAVGKITPQIYLSSSPQKKLKFLRDLVMDPSVVTLTGRTEENRGNVSEAWYHAETKRLGGTRQGAEELGGELGLDDGAEDLFSMTLIDETRVVEAPNLDRIVVAVDPSGSQRDDADETGIVGVGRAGDLETGHAYPLADETGKHRWETWGTKVVKMAETLGASAIVVERNKYADAAMANVRTCAVDLGYKFVAAPEGTKRKFYVGDLVHKETGRRIQLLDVLALGDKATRAGPVSTLYQKRRVHHVGRLTRLEIEQTTWDPKCSDSPNGLDALVHGITELFEFDRSPAQDYSPGFEGVDEANAALRGASARAAGKEIDSAHDSPSLAYGLGEAWEGRVI